MRHFLNACAGLALLIGSTTPLRAQMSPAKPMENFGFRLYAEGCGRYIAEPDALATFLRSRFLVPADTEVAARLLHGLPGNAWVLRNDYEGITVTSQLGGKHCSVRIQQGDPEILRGYFLRLMEGKPGDETRREKIVDREVSGPAGPVRQLVYRTSIPSLRVQDVYILYSMMMRTDAAGMTVAILSVSIAKGDLSPN